jgi:mRNA (guanine-N7-)-methyltransferase
MSGKIGGTANDYGTAISIWRSITNPITEGMIKGIDALPEHVPGVDIYYYRQNNRDKMLSINMMKFHNKIKTYLITGQSNRKNSSLFDMSCGKGGDINKWVSANFSKVMGVDISRDNIENPNDGAFARTLGRNSNLNYMFAIANSAKKFDHETLVDPVNRFLWGIEKNNTLSQKYYGFAKDKFDVVSCQFSLHYFFESEDALDNFIWNVDTHLKPGGTFIGTYLDSKEVMKKLKDKDSISGKRDQKILWSIEKKYDPSIKKSTYSDKIDVFMESIGIVFTESLVNFDILKKKLASKGLELVSHTCFKDLYEEDKDKLDKQEKTYSFMNYLFVFKKKEDTK